MLETGMENLFKQNLLRLRKPLPPQTFAEALLGPVLWGRPKVATEVGPVVAKERFSEKAQVLESLERFAQEKIAEAETPIKFDRGEIHLKPEAGWISQEYSDLNSLISDLSFTSEIKNIIFQNKVLGEVKVIFVSENFRDWSESSPELKEGFINELILGFPLKTAEYFERMIQAMKLLPSEVVIYPADHGDIDLASEVIALTAYFQPEVVITLGAIASNKILKSNDRLQSTHGQFFTRKINSSLNFNIVPLFHPSIIESNLNMKKTAWTDMQKIMKHLKKLP